MAYDSIDLFGEKGIINGYPSGNFGPNDTLNRSTYITLVVRALGFKNLRGEEGEEAEHWAKPYVDLATELKLVNYVSKADYDKPISRQEVARIAVKATKITEYPVYLSAYQGMVKDYEDIDGKYKEDILKSIDLGILTGSPDGTFGPLKFCTRAEASIIINRILDQSMRDRVRVIFSSEDQEFKQIKDKEKYYNSEDVKFIDEGKIAFRANENEIGYFLPNYSVKNSNDIAYKLVTNMIKLAKKYNAYATFNIDDNNQFLIMKYYASSSKELKKENISISFYYGKEAIDSNISNGKRGYRMLWNLTDMFPQQKYDGWSRDNQIHPEMEDVTKSMFKVLYDDNFTNNMFTYMADKYRNPLLYFYDNKGKYEYESEDIISGRNVYTNVNGWVLFYTKMP